MQTADPPRDDAQEQGSGNNKRDNAHDSAAAAEPDSPRDDADERDSPHDDADDRAAREHDAAHKLLYSHRRMVADLLRGFLPEGEWPGFDYASLEPLTASQVGRGLARREGDRMWRLRARGAPGGGWVYVLVLLEFQSTVDRFMALRVLTYAGLAWEGVLRSGTGSWQDGSGGKRPGTPLLPLVIPFVVYNGSRPWTAPLDIAELLVQATGELARLQPSARYVLLDLQRADVGHVPGDNAVGLQAALEQSTPEASAPVLRRLEAALAGPEHAGLRRAFATWLRWSCVWGYEAFEDGDGELGRELDRLEQSGEVLKMGSLAFERWKERNRRNEALIRERALEQGMERGMQQGMQQGMERGLERERRLLANQAARRFGPDAGERLSALLAGVTEPEHLEAVGEAIIDSGSGAELLAAARRIAGVANSAG